MTSIAEIRAKFPQYEDMSDGALANALHAKFYSDMPRDQFDVKLGLSEYDTSIGRASEASSKLKGGPGAPEQITDYDRSVFAQVVSGVNEGIAETLGMPVDMANYALGGTYNVINALTGSDLKTSDNPVGGGKRFTSAMGDAISPETDDPGLNYLRRTSREVGGALVPLAPVAATAAKPLKSAVSQLATSIGSGIGAATAEAIAPDNPYLEMAGLILGGGVVAGATAAGRKAISPMRVPAERRGAINTLRDEGVDLTAGQITGSKNLKGIESELGGADAQAFMERQAEQFTSAALARAGVSARRASPEVMDDAFTEIGSRFDDLSARNAIVPDREMSDNLASVVRNYNSVVNRSARAPVIEDTLRDIIEHVRPQGGGLRPISGEAYKSIRSSLGRKARSATVPELKEALNGMIDALDDAMERSITVSNSQDLVAWREVRTQYRNLIAIETAASRAGEKAVTGIITPSNLRSAVASQGRRAYVRGKGELNALARAGVEVMSPLPDSGTATRTAARNFLTSIPTAVGAVAGGAVGGGPGALAGLAIGAVAPSALGKAVLSASGRRYLTNDLIKGPALAADEVIAPLIAATANNDTKAARPEPLRIVVRP